MTAEHRDIMMKAVESAGGPAKLRQFVTELVDQCIPIDMIVEDLSQIVAIVDPDREDDVLTVMDFLTGWCSPHERIEPPERCLEQQRVEDDT